MSKRIFSFKTVLTLLATVCLAFAFGGLLRVNAQADAGDNNITAKVESVESREGGSWLMLYFQYDEGYTTDYMTADWSPENNASYHWYLKGGDFGMPAGDEAKYDSLGGQLAYEDKDKYNMPNALLNKNLDAYNMGDYILIDGVPLKNYEYTLFANRLTRVHSLSIELANGSTLFSTATNLEIKAGCTIPTLTYSYFGEGEPSALVIEEQQLFRAKNGGWVKAYPFDGYEKGVEYDASERFFYLRPHGTSLKGHTEAETYAFTSIFSERGWGDDGYAIASTEKTEKGTILVLDFVNPIDANQFGLIDLRVFSNTPRSFVSHNAYEITEDSLGVVVEQYSIPQQSFSTITLFSALYADENGMIDQLVFEFTENGNVDPTQNQFFVGSFILRENTINSIVYDDSLLIQDLGDYYDLTLRFNKKGEFSGSETVDTSKVLLNGVSVDEMNANGANVTAKWGAIQGIYQINVTVPKAYKGAGQLQNAEYNYTGTKVSVAKDLVFPNGDLLDRTYTCNVYAKESFVDYEFLKEYKNTQVVSVKVNIDANSANNIHFYIEFDQKICSQVYYHADDSEGWRETALDDVGLYDKDFSKVYIAGGFKSSLLDNIMINGKTLGEWHAIDPYETCVFAHYAQFSPYTLDLSVDSRSEVYQQLLPLFESGNDITLTIKEGMKFPTGIKTTADCEYVLENGVLISGSASGKIGVFFDGKPVQDGDVLKKDTEALESSVYVQGVSDYTVTKTTEGNVATFVVEYNGQQLTFSVEQNVTWLDPVDKVTQDADEDKKSSLFGCGSAISGGLIGGSVLIAFAASGLMRRKKDEENQ